MNRKAKQITSSIPAKANRILNLILFAFLLIMLRLWHLGVIQHEERVEEARKPQQKVVIEPSKRGTIRDRFNIPLAINKVHYNAAVLYSQIKQIPAIAWETVEGKKIKRYKRRDYITELSHLLANELHLDPERLEDLIHAKASLYTQHPFIIKEDLTEQEYYRIKALEMDWPGLIAQSTPKRHYPLEKVAGDIVGYMGAISRDEYEKVIHEIAALENHLKSPEWNEIHQLPEGIESHEELENRLQTLIDHAYSLNDSVGKMGIEAKFEKKLRGSQGKKIYKADAHGNFLRELEGAKDAKSGNRILLTISAELQEYAEKLLIQNESIRDIRVESKNKNELEAEKEPWIKGGAIVALDPNQGEILALASYPRYNPNDFVTSGNKEIANKKHQNIRRWHETESHIGEIWDMKRPLERERYNKIKDIIYEEQAWLDWNKYLEFILPKDSPVHTGLQNVGTVKNAKKLQEIMVSLLDLSGGPNAYALLNALYDSNEHQPHKRMQLPGQKEALAACISQNAEKIAVLKKQLDPYFEGISHNYDKILLVDLCRLIVDADLYPDELLPSTGNQKLADYRKANSAMAMLEETVRNFSQDLFHANNFKEWREIHQKDFLKQKRLEEKEAGKKFGVPYLDLLDAKEKELFNEFWQTEKWDIILTMLGKSRTKFNAYNDYFSIWKDELAQGAHKEIHWYDAYWTLKNTTSELSTEDATSYLKSFRSYKNLNRPLYGYYRAIKTENGKQLEKHLAAGFYPTYGYGYGRSYAYRQAAPQGSVFKLVTAYAALVQKLQEQQSNLQNPIQIIDHTHKRDGKVYIGYDSQGQPIPQIYKGGRIPRSARSGIGKLDLLKAFEVSSNPYFSLMAAECLKNPSDLSEAAKIFSYGAKTGIELPAEIKGSIPEDLDHNRNGLYAMAIGQHSLVVTPLQTAVMLAAIANGGKIIKPKIVGMTLGIENERPIVSIIPANVQREISMPTEVRKLLLEGMKRVAEKALWASMGSLSRQYKDHPEAINDLIELSGQLIGKSSTAEAREHVDLDLLRGIHMYNHVWFGGIVFDPKKEPDKTAFVFNDSFGQPELVVIVYLRYGAWGKDVAPLAAQVAQKWREIKRKRQEVSSQ